MTASSTGRVLVFMPSDGKRILISLGVVMGCCHEPPYQCLKVDDAFEPTLQARPLCYFLCRCDFFQSTANHGLYNKADYQS